MFYDVYKNGIIFFYNRNFSFNNSIMFFYWMLFLIVSLNIWLKKNNKNNKNKKLKKK